MKYPIYLDYNSTTPVDPFVLEAMLPYFSTDFGNAASLSHLYGWVAEKAVEQTRKQIAQFVETLPEGIIFTSGATESNNLALFGIMRQYRQEGNHFITAQTEHKSVLDPFKRLEAEGFSGTYLSVDSQGQISLDALEEAISSKTILVSLMAANNETGVLHPLAEIGKICRQHRILFHCDATQALGKISLSLEKMQIDLLSCSAHKLYGPKGIGALALSRKKIRFRLEPLLFGGGHEQGFRSGTLNVPGIVGFGKAVELAEAKQAEEASRFDSWRRYFYESVCQQLSGVFLNGKWSQALPNTLHLSFAGISGNRLLSHLKKIAVSSGSACTSASLEPSHVLKAMGVSDDLARASLRLSFGRFTTVQELDEAILEIVSVVQELRATMV